MFYRIHFNDPRDNEFEADNLLAFLMLAIVIGATISFIIIYFTILR